ncbi:PREDICTED: 21 kDa protein [Fragaria vesca subsp. vesca]|uniref:21 kDa protein n=1 Tax=Fragaria vesca subsp. vesca TaxID=101020 RepID=UPI0002C35954|nr:PREDICTED: 21 kDa protein [Fragaria vesca subsp. vesca]
MKNTQCLLLLVLPFICLLFLHPTSAVGVPFPTADPANFIRTSCNTTLYPDLCYSSLSPFTNNVQSNLTRLAKAAIAVSLRSSRHTMILLTSLSAQADPKVAGALRDCFSNFGDAFEEIRESLDQMKTLGSGTGSVRFQLSNVQTWISAALTDAETCTDGFEDVEDGPIKTEVVNKAEMVKKMMSNALAIVNGLASSNGTPP